MSYLVRKGLSFNDLTEIHRWLVSDYEENNDSDSLLHCFMKLVVNRKLAWGLFYDNTVCVGFILLLKRCFPLHQITDIMG